MLLLLAELKSAKKMASDGRFAIKAYPRSFVGKINRRASGIIGIIADVMWNTPLLHMAKYPQGCR
jgi:hypothetical protein